MVEIGRNLERSDTRQVENEILEETVEQEAARSMDAKRVKVFTWVSAVTTLSWRLVRSKVS